MFPEETASNKFVHTEQKNHWSMHEIVTKFHVTRLVNQSKILPFAWIKILIIYWCPAHKNHHLSPKIKQNPDSWREHDINLWYAKLAKE